MQNLLNVAPKYFQPGRKGKEGRIASGWRMLRMANTVINNVAQGGGRVAGAGVAAPASAECGIETLVVVTELPSCFLFSQPQH